MSDVFWHQCGLSYVPAQKKGPWVAWHNTNAVLVHSAVLCISRVKADVGMQLLGNQPKHLVMQRCLCGASGVHESALPAQAQDRTRRERDSKANPAHEER